MRIGCCFKAGGSLAILHIVGGVMRYLCVLSRGNPITAASIKSAVHDTGRLRLKLQMSMPWSNEQVWEFSWTMTDACARTLVLSGSPTVAVLLGTHPVFTKGGAAIFITSIRYGKGRMLLFLVDTLEEVFVRRLTEKEYRVSSFIIDILIWRNCNVGYRLGWRNHRLAIVWIYSCSLALHFFPF